MPPAYADPPPALVCDPLGSQYEMEKQLGRGGFAICWQAQQADTAKAYRRAVALKIVKSRIEHRRVAQKFVTELQLHSKLRHPNIVAFYQAFTYGSSTYVVLELCTNGSLADWLKNRLYLSMPEVRRCIIQICGAMKYLRTRNIVHRDLKAGNLFLDRGMNIKVGDFGLAAVLVSPDDASIRRTTMCGTPNYIAPEVLEKRGRGHNERVDIWAIGILAYTLAVGRAPFHASKPDQVLLRVATGEYTWPVLEKHQNDIPDYLRELVSQILVDEDLRPSLDTIVSHNFFKMGFLPDSLSEEALTSTPMWAVDQITPSTTNRDYTEAWYKQCKASGVGEYAPGEFFSVVGDLPSSSVYRECEREAESGRMPVVPMPKNAIYTPFSYTRGKGMTGGLENMKERENSFVSSNLIKSSVKTRHNIHNTSEPFQNKQGAVRCHNQTAAQVPQARAPDFSFTESTNNARGPALPRPITAAKDTGSAKPEIRKLAARPKHTMREQSPILLSRTQAMQATCRTSSHGIYIAKNATSRTALPTRATSWHTARGVSGITKGVPLARTDSRTTTRTQRKQASTIPGNIPQPTRSVSIPDLQSLPSTHDVFTRSKSSIASDVALGSPHMDPPTILAKAEQLRNNLITALTSGGKPSSISCKSDTAIDHLPFVCKWVDYSRKHGIGYVLADGNVGTIANHTDVMPITHTVVNHGYKYFEATYEDFTFRNIPFQFFIQAYDGSLEEVTMTGAARKQHASMWARFARYMCKQLNKHMIESEGEKREQPTAVVRFYQRVGNVSVWGFNNGCFQFNFPDYTKIVLSAGGTRISFTVLPLSAIEHINKGLTDFPFEFIKAREVISGTVDQLLEGGKQAMNPTVGSDSSSSQTNVLALSTANALPDKLRFAVELLCCWIPGGGLGCKHVGTQWPKWEGTTLDDAWGNKLDWVTVGRLGGDERQERTLRYLRLITRVSENSHIRYIMLFHLDLVLSNVIFPGSASKFLRKNSDENNPWIKSYLLVIAIKFAEETAPPEIHER